MNICLTAGSDKSAVSALHANGSVLQAASRQTLVISFFKGDLLPLILWNVELPDAVRIKVAECWNLCMKKFVWFLQEHSPRHLPSSLRLHALPGGRYCIKCRNPSSTS